ncbi:hypothetical protein [Azospirillum sp. B506]|nr:hypothetical protein [Azospirillum sp. B506]
MTGFTAGSDDAEIAAVTNDVLGHFGGKQASATPADVAAPRR